MIDDIITGIAQSIARYFSDCEIHIDKLPQGFQEPCFFIRPLSCTQKQIIGERYCRTHGFNIRYYPKSRNPAKELNAAADILCWALEYITLSNGEIRGTDMHYEFHDEVLHFFVNYDVFVFKKRDRGPFMRYLKQVQKIKG